MGRSKQKIRATLGRKSLNLSRGRTGSWRALFFHTHKIRRLESIAKYLTSAPRREIRHIVERCYLNWAKTCQVFGIRRRNRVKKARHWRVQAILSNVKTVCKDSLPAESAIEPRNFSDSSRLSEWENLSSSSLKIEFSPKKSNKEYVKIEGIKLNFKPDPSKYVVRKAYLEDMSSSLGKGDSCYVLFEENASTLESKSLEVVEKDVIGEEKIVAKEDKGICRELESTKKEKKLTEEEEEKIAKEGEKKVSEKEEKEFTEEKGEKVTEVKEKQKVIEEKEEEKVAEVGIQEVSEDEKKLAGNVRKPAATGKDNWVVEKEENKTPEEGKKITDGKGTKVVNEEVKKVVIEEDLVEKEKSAEGRNTLNKDIAEIEEQSDSIKSTSEVTEILLSPLVVKIMKNFTNRVEKTTAFGKLSCVNNSVENVCMSKESPINEGCDSDKSKKRSEEIMEKNGQGKPNSKVLSVAENPFSPVSSISACSSLNVLEMLQKSAGDELNSDSDRSSIVRYNSFLSSPESVIVVSSDDDVQGSSRGKEKSKDENPLTKRDNYPPFSARFTALPFRKENIPTGNSAENVRKEDPIKSVLETVETVNGISKSVHNEEKMGQNNCEESAVGIVKIGMSKETSRGDEPVSVVSELRLVLAKKDGLQDKPRAKFADEVIASETEKSNGFTTSTPEKPCSKTAKSNFVVSSTGTQTDSVEAPSAPTAKDHNTPIMMDAETNTASPESISRDNRRKMYCHCRKLNLEVPHLHKKVAGLKKILLRRTSRYRADRNALAFLLKDHTKFTKSYCRLLKKHSRIVEDNSNVIRVLGEYLKEKHSGTLTVQQAKEVELRNGSDIVPTLDSEKVPESPKGELASPKPKELSLSSVTRQLFGERNDTRSAKEFKRQAKKRLSLSQATRVVKESTGIVGGWDVIRQKAAEFGSKGRSSPILNSSAEPGETKCSQECGSQSTENSLIVGSSELSVASNVGSCTKESFLEEKPKTEEQTVEELKKCLQELDEVEELHDLPRKRRHIRFQLDEEDEIAAGSSAASEPLSKLRQSLRLVKARGKESSPPVDQKFRKKVISTKGKKSLSSDEDTSWNHYIKDLVGRLAKDYLPNDSHASKESSKLSGCDNIHSKEGFSSTKIVFQNEDILSFLFLDEQLAFRSRKIDPNFEEFSYDEVALQKILSGLRSNGDVIAAEEAVLSQQILGRFGGDAIRKQLRQYLKIFSSAPFYFHVHLDLLTGTEALRIVANEARCCGERIESLEGVKVPVETACGGLLEFIDDVAKDEKARLTVLVGPASFTSHSCSPNAKIVSVDRNTFKVVALRDILPGEELLIAEGSDSCCDDPIETTRRKGKLNKNPKIFGSFLKSERPDSIFKF